MTIEKFLEDFQDILQRDDPVTLHTPLRDMAEWDSLAVMSCIAWLDKKFGVTTTVASYRNLQTVADIAALVKGIKGTKGAVA
jgi:acyl carrier protein